ncbi:MAG: ATP-binding protein [Agriterribacter sp.]
MANTFKVDLSNCDREPIHIPGFIQPHGFLLAMHPGTYVIEKVSENTSVFLNLAVTDILGKKISVFEKDYVVDNVITDIIKIGVKSGNFDSNNPCRITLNNKVFDLVIHQNKDHIILEFEAQEQKPDEITLQKIMTNALGKIQAAKSLQELLDNVALLVKNITGYDRVMVYKFHKDQHGEVVSEAVSDNVDSFLHLHYPASDIPVQARALYKLNQVRLIADVNATPSALKGLTSEASAPLDLTYSVLRAVSPVHIEYLQNMGVSASFSISLIYKNELWGLIACHHYQPKFIDYNSRMACKFVGQLFSAALEFRTDEDDNELAAIYNANEHTLYEQMAKDLNIAAGLVHQKINLLNINNARGAALFFENRMYTLGVTPSEPEIQNIINWLRQYSFQGVYYTTDLPVQFEDAKPVAATASGVMVVEISPRVEEFIIWFKPEIIKNVDWAGNPEKALVKINEQQERLSPRKSFEKWKQEVKFTSDDWANIEITTALKLKEDILHVINRKSSEIRKLNDLLRKAYEELDTFTYTISHDLKTPLSTIKNYTEIIIEDYGKDMPEDATGLLHKIVKGTDKMNQLIRDVLHYTRVGRTGMKFSNIPMKELLEEIKEDVLEASERKDVIIDIGNVIDLQGDKTMLTQMFANLMGNAVKYSSGVKKPVAKINAELKEDQVVYTVSDNGIGLDMKYSARIFELFRRLDNVKNISGTGVGLAIVKRIVEKHNGRIWVESELNKGTKFYISLPK